MDFFASNVTMIILAIVGIGLIVVEMFLPGIGLPGVSGLIMLMAAIWLVWRAYGALWGIGREGVTQTPLRPSGIIVIDGERKSVVTEGEFLDAGKTVRIIHVNGSRIVVEPVSK